MSMSTIKIPTQWTADEALTVAYFLENIIEAIWDIHGHQMSRYLQVSYNGSITARIHEIEDQDEPYPEIPF